MPEDVFPQGGRMISRPGHPTPQESSQDSPWQSKTNRHGNLKIFSNGEFLDWIRFWE